MTWTLLLLTGVAAVFAGVCALWGPWHAVLLLGAQLMLAGLVGGRNQALRETFEGAEHEAGD